MWTVGETFSDEIFGINIRIDEQTATGIRVQGLTPRQTHYLAVRTFTPAHGEQKNDIWSEYSTELAVSTLARPGTVIFFPVIR
jgi:hypothetical protein